MLKTSESFTVGKFDLTMKYVSEGEIPVCLVHRILLSLLTSLLISRRDFKFNYL